ncbi:uncharacterized protein M6B38_376565 [Iris pallida]|uniref:Transposase n=1 Tax=Iris pallida TaxID=29817 RepID=A0AAX6GA31_IRIPA|nr:uncharacterized protein M6B38_376565 [Iris pallida]
MEKSKNKIYLRPGQTAQLTSAYEKQRIENIARNQRKFEALGLLHATNLLAPFEKVTQTSLAKNSKRNASERDDNEYRPGDCDDLLSSYSSEDENNGHSNPQMEKVIYNGPTRKSSRLISTPEDNMTEGSNNLQLHVPSPMESPASGAGSQKKNTRGKTRGKAVEKMVQKIGKLQVPIATTERASVGENATALANQIGIEIRAAAPLQDVMYWDYVDDSLKKSIILRVRDKFEIKNYDDDEVVRRAITKICQLRYKDWRSRMHAHYKSLLKNGVNPRSKPYKGVSQEDWEYMIDRVWTTNEKFKKRSEQNVVARSSLPWNHSCGSKSFAATMSTKAEMPHFVDFFKKSHWSKKKDDWLDPKCMEKHGELENLRTMCSQPNAIPMSEEEMSVAVLGKKSSYLRGYGVGRKPSNTKTTFRENGEEAIILREELTSLKELNKTQQQQLEAQQQQISAQNKKLEMFQAVLMRCGLLSSDQCGEDSAEGC